MASSSACTRCGGDAISPPGSSGAEACTCLPGSELQEGSQGVCSACGPGKFRTGEVEEATPVENECPNGPTSVGDLCGCNQATDGSLACVQGICRCFMCPSGFTLRVPKLNPNAMPVCIGVFQRCVDCPQHATSTGARTSRQHCKCLPGYAGPDGGACAACGVGTYKETVDGSCLQCAAGTYSSTAAATSCATCEQITIANCVCSSGICMH